MPSCATSRFGRDGSELTTKAYAGGIALFLRWCERTGRSWHSGVEHLGLFLTWLRHAGPDGATDRCSRGRGCLRFAEPGG
jgi:integrase/recombinase XerD